MADGGFIDMTDFVPGADTSREFRDALGRFATGVTVVTCQCDLGPMGIHASGVGCIRIRIESHDFLQQGFQFRSVNFKDGRDVVPHIDAGDVGLADLLGESSGCKIED